MTGNCCSFDGSASITTGMYALPVSKIYYYYFIKCAYIENDLLPKAQEMSLLPKKGMNPITIV